MTYHLHLSFPCIVYLFLEKLQWLECQSSIYSN